MIPTNRAAVNSACPDGNELSTGCGMRGFIPFATI